MNRELLSKTGWEMALGAATLVGLTALVLIFTKVLLDPPRGDLVAMAGFLLISGRCKRAGWNGASTLGVAPVGQVVAS